MESKGKISWKTLYEDLVIEYSNAMKEIDTLRTILHTYMPIIGEKKDQSGGNI